MNGSQDETQVSEVKEEKDEDQVEAGQETAKQSEAQDEDRVIEGEKHEEKQGDEKQEQVQVEEIKLNDTSVETPVEEATIEGQDDVESIDCDEEKKNLSIDCPSDDECKMFVGQIPRDWTDIQVRQLFNEFGKINAVNVLRDRHNNLSKGK